MSASPRGAVTVLAIAGAMLAMAQVHRVGGGVIAPELADRFQVSGAMLGLIMGAMYLTSAVTQVPMGLAYDRFGARRTMSCAALIGLGGTLVFGFAAGVPGLLAGRILVGIGFAGVVTAILLLTMRWAPPERFATVGASTMALANIGGSLIATVPLGRSLNVLGWQPTFVVLAVCTGGVILLVLLLVRDAPAGHEPARPAGGLIESLRTFRRLLEEPPLRATLAMGIAAIAPFICTAGLWAGPYLREVHGLEAGATNALLLSMMLLMNATTSGFGPLDRRFNTRKRVVMGGAGVVTLALTGLALIPGLPLVPALVLLYLVAAGSPFYVTLAAHARAFVPEAEAGRLIGVLNLVALVGASLAQWLTGLVVSALADPGALGSAAGYRAAFGSLAILVLGAILGYRRAPDRPPRPA